MTTTHTTRTDTTRLADALAEIRQILAKLDELSDSDSPTFSPEPDAITETMRLRFSGMATGTRDYRTGEPLPIDPDNIDPDDRNTVAVIDLPRGIAYTIRPPYLSLVRDNHAQIVAYCDVYRIGNRYSGSLLIPLTPEAMPGNGQPVRPYWDHYPTAYTPSPSVLPPGARDIVARSVADLVPEITADAVRIARIHALHKEAAGELYAGLVKARMEIENALRNATTHARNAIGI